MQSSTEPPSTAVLPAGDSLWNLSAADLLARSASAAPTPGGGSVAALSGAFGLALVCMSLAVTRRGKQAEQAAELETLSAEADTLLQRLKAHPDADVQAFQRYLAAQALPRQDEAQVQARRAALQAAAQVATAAPLSAARDLLSALELAERAAAAVSRRIVSDVGAGAALLAGALHATLLMVDINVGGLPQEASAAAQAERQALAGMGRECAAVIEVLVAQRLAASS